MGLDVDLQATTKAQALLGKQRHEITNRSVMDWKDVPAFYKILCEASPLTQLALRLLILGGRSNPLRHMHKDQVDGDIWTIPAENMKGRRDATTEFRVPLSLEALEILKQARSLSLAMISSFLQPVGVLLVRIACHNICNRLDLICNRLDLKHVRMVFVLVYAIGSLKQPMPPMRSLKLF